MTDEPTLVEDLEEPTGEEPSDREEPDLPDLPVGDLPKGAPKEPGLPPPRD